MKSILYFLFSLAFRKVRIRCNVLCIIYCSFVTVFICSPFSLCLQFLIPKLAALHALIDLFIKHLFCGTYQGREKIINITTYVGWNPVNKKLQFNRGCILWSPDPPSMEGEDTDQTQPKAGRGNFLVGWAESYGEDIMGKEVTCAFCDRSL